MVCQFHLIFFTLLNIEFEAHRLVAPCAVGSESLAVDLERESTGVLHADDRLARLFGDECSLVESREILHLHTVGKSVLTICSHSDRIKIVFLSYWFARTADVIPECASNTLLAIGRALRQETVDNTFLGEVASLEIRNVLLAHLGTNAIENSDSGVRSAVVISPHHRDIVGIRSDDSNFLFLGERQQSLISNS